MGNKTRENIFKLSEKGFTLIELIVSSVVVIVLLALVSGIIKSQGNTFSRQ